MFARSDKTGAPPLDVEQTESGRYLVLGPGRLADDGFGEYPPVFSWYFDDSSRFGDEPYV